MAKKAAENSDLMDGFLDGLTDKHGELNVRFDKVELRWRGTPLGIELNGSLAVSVHMRDLTNDEKQAYIRENLGRIRGK
jgi:hypothetical protein